MADMTKSNIEREIMAIINRENIEGLKAKLHSNMSVSNEVKTIKNVTILLDNNYEYTGRGNYDFSGYCMAVKKINEDGHIEALHKLRGRAFVEEGDNSPCVTINSVSITEIK